MKQCPICKNVFEPKVFHQVYDRMSCRNRAERQRAQLRDKGAEVDGQGGTRRADHADVPASIEATPEKLDEMAQVFLRNPTALPLFWHNVPAGLEWTPPEGVWFKKQTDTEIWVMCHLSYTDTKPKVVAPPPLPKRSVMAVLDKFLPVTEKPKPLTLDDLTPTTPKYEIPTT